MRRRGPGENGDKRWRGPEERGDMQRRGPSGGEGECDGAALVGGDMRRRGPGERGVMRRRSPSGGHMRRHDPERGPSREPGEAGPRAIPAPGPAGPGPRRPCPPAAPQQSGAARPNSGTATTAPPTPGLRAGPGSPTSRPVPGPAASPRRSLPPRGSPGPRLRGLARRETGRRWRQRLLAPQGPARPGRRHGRRRLHLPRRSRRRSDAQTQVGHSLHCWHSTGVT